MAADGFSRRSLISEDPEERTYTMRAENETLDEGDGVPYSLVTYDHYDRIIEERYFDASGQPTEGPEGCSIVQRDYTSRNQVSLIRYFDSAGNSMKINGAYGIASSYNSFGKLETETWLDADGAPAVNEDGYASIHYDYDLSDASRAEKYFQYYLDAQGQPVAAANGAWGMNTVYYPVTRVHVLTFVDEAGKPVTTSEGYAILEYEQDENGNRTWEGYYDAIHAAINCLEGYASKETTFDSNGRKVAERYLDRYNKLTNNADGVAGWNGYYDSEGQLVITNCYDQDRNPVEADLDLAA